MAEKLNNNKTMSTETSSKCKLFFENNYPLIIRVVFFVFAFLFLGVYYQDYLYQIGWRNYFVSNEPFEILTVNQTSGWLFYVSLFCNQVFLWPTIGALVVVFLLTGIQYFIEKLLGLTKTSLILSYLPSFLLLLMFGGAGYAIFAQFPMATFFATIFGTIWALILFYIYRKFNQPYVCWILWIVNILLLPIFGLFSVISMLMIGLDLLKEKKIILLIATILVSPLVLYVWGHYIFIENFNHTICMPFPLPYFTNLFVIAILLGISLLSIPYANLLNEKLPKVPYLIQPAAFVMLCLMVFFFSFRDTNFKAIVTMSRLVDQMEWKEAMKVAEKIKHPTKGVNCYRLIAAMAEGKLNEKVFDVCLPFSPSKSNYLNEKTIYVSDEYFYASFFNMSYLYCMDSWVELNESYKSLKTMTLIALLRDEKELAERYVRLMKDAPALRSYANELEQYITNKQLFFERYPIYKTLSENMPQENFPQTITNHISTFYLWYNHLNNENIQRRLLANLYQHNVDKAIEEYLFLRKNGWTDKTHLWFQEALVVKGLQTNNLDFIKTLHIDPIVIARVQSCFNDFFKKSKDDLYNKGEELYEKYKGCYAYYFLFDNYKFNEILPQYEK